MRSSPLALGRASRGWRYDYPEGKLRARVGLGAAQVGTRQVKAVAKAGPEGVHFHDPRHAGNTISADLARTHGL